MQKRIVFMLMISTLFTTNAFPQIAKQILPYKGAPDPHIHIFNDKAYLFAGHDFTYNTDDFIMKDWWIWSSSDLVNWEHEFTLDPKDTYIGESDKCFATDAAERNGKYYWYVSDFIDEIAVFVADKPGGPYKDVLEKPLVPLGLTNCHQFDPTVFIDDDEAKTPYLLFGETWNNTNYHICRLSDDMVTLAETPKKIEIEGIYRLQDKQFLFKREGTYYLIWANNYAVSDNIYGPYKVGGKFFGGHSSVFQWHNQWYIATSDLPWCPGCLWPFMRASSMFYMHFLGDGTPYVDWNSGYGVGEYDSRRPVLQAENYFRASGVKKVNDFENHFYIVPSSENGNITFPNIHGLTENETVTFNVISPTGGWEIEVRENDLHGKILGTCSIPDTKKKPQLIPCKLQNPSGTMTLCFVFKGNSEWKPYLDYFTFAPNAKEMVTPITHWDFYTNAQGWRTMQNEDADYGEGFIKLPFNKAKSIKSPKLPATNLSEGKIVMLRLKNQSGCRHASLFFSLVDDKIDTRKQVEEWPSENKTDFSIIPNSGYTDYVIDMREVQNWNNGKLKQLRIDFNMEGTEGDIELSDVEIWKAGDFIFSGIYKDFKK